MLIIGLPISAFIGRRFKDYRWKIQQLADRRLKLTNELLAGVRIVKYYAWENAFMKNIDAARVLELVQVIYFIKFNSDTFEGSRSWLYSSNYATCNRKYEYCYHYDYFPLF